MELKNTALTDIHISLDARMVPFAGYNMPVRYSSDIEEHLTVRNGVGVFDVSHMGEFMIEGPSALDFIQNVTSNDASKLQNGQIQYSCFPNDKGGIIDDLLVYRFNDEKFMLVVNASNIDKDWQWLKEHNSFGADMENISDNISLFAIQGPKSTDVLQKVTDCDLSSLKFYSFLKGNLGDTTNSAIISATGYTGAGGYEVYAYNEFAKDIWNLIFEAGEEFDIKPIGLGARDTLRLEMGYCLYGNDIDDTTSPIEAGLGWITKFTKDFINKDSLLKQKEEGTKKKLVGFEMVDRGIPRNGYDILNTSGNKIGHVTSGTMSPSMGIGIGLGYVNSEYRSPDTEIVIAIRNRQLRAKVVKLPIFKG